MATPTISVLLPISVLCIILLTSFVSSDISEDEFEGSRTLSVEHSYTSASSESYIKRGTIVIQSLKGNRAHFAEADSISNEDRNLLRTAAKQGDLYRVRIPVKTVDDEVSYVSSATTACSILESGLSDVITVSFDQSGEVLGVSVHGNVAACAGRDMPAANLTRWQTSVEITTTVPGPVPDTQTYIDKMKRDEQEKAKNQDGDNRSFLGKYWMYIVPVVIMMVVMSSADQQGGGGGGGAR